jgi:Protein of unknown function (DUF2442)
MTIGKITAVSITGSATLNVTWDDGRNGPIDLSLIIAHRPALAPLANADEFAQAVISPNGWSLEWPCGIDFGGPQLRRWADEQGGETMAAHVFRRWVEGNALTLDRAAQALGLSRRTIAYYLSGEQPIPKTVMLATIGYDHQQAA